MIVGGKRSYRTLNYQVFQSQPHYTSGGLKVYVKYLRPQGTYIMVKKSRGIK